MNGFNEVVGILRELIDILEQPGTDVCWSRYENVEEAVNDLRRHIERLEHCDLSEIGKLVTLFAPTGSIQEISLSSGWGVRYLFLADQFDSAIKQIRPK